ncbi:MAG: NifU family protein [Planctomycetes bacterium]|nr:NifU family protein [Planctomycetota bacterium]
MIADEVVTISLKGQGDVDWQIAGKKIADMIRQQLCSGEAAVSDKIKETLPSEGDIQKQVQQVLDTEINPAVAAHGGHVSLLDVKANRIYLEFGGGCQGCGMVDVTLKHGVEKAIREKIPAIGQILDTTDHASGKNPYYSPSKK